SNARAFNLGRFKSVFISVTLDKKLVCVFNLFRSLSPSSVASVGVPEGSLFNTAVKNRSSWPITSLKLKDQLPFQMGLPVRNCFNCWDYGWCHL
ncbi:hypothetical protein L9F63_022714, partial [Diploptera punctata]